MSFQLSIVFSLIWINVSYGFHFKRLSQISLSPLRMSSTPPSIQFQSSTVASGKNDGIGLKRIEIQVSNELASQYSTPGQYVQIKLGDGKPGFYAIASPPDGRDILSFLVKETENNQWLTTSSSGSKLDVSQPQGKGFQIENYFEKYQFDFPTTNVYLMATGSGLAPIAAAIESSMLGINSTPKNSYATRTATLYIGAKTEGHLPLQEKYSSWESMGVKIIPVLSASGSTWSGRKGYIQNALEEDVPRVPRNTGALLCGQRAMTDKVREILLTAGVFEGRILQNF